MVSCPESPHPDPLHIKPDLLLVVLVVQKFLPGLLGFLYLDAVVENVVVVVESVATLKAIAVRRIIEFNSVIEDLLLILQLLDKEGG